MEIEKNKNINFVGMDIPRDNQTILTETGKSWVKHSDTRGKVSYLKQTPEAKFVCFK